MTSRTGKLLVFCCLFAIAASGVVSPPANAQVGRSKPPAGYFAAFGALAEGDFSTALDRFRVASRMGFRSAEGRWVDSVCYHTMMGECLYRMGQLPKALEQYNTAARIFLLNRDWMRRVEFPASIGPSPSRIRQTINWGTRNTAMGRYPDSMQVMFGQMSPDQVLQRGGTYAPPEIHSINVHEIARCIALSLRRRAELLGPTCQYDSLSGQLLNAVESRIGPVNHWASVWVEVQRGMALLGAGKQSEAADALKRSLLVAGQYDHPLTGMALLELGKLAAANEQYQAAGDFFLQASIAAAEFEQYSDMEEALHRATAVHLASNDGVAFAPIERAAAWALQRRLRHLHASLFTDGAAATMAAGEDATALLAKARQGQNRRAKMSPELAARWSALSARNDFAKQRVKSAEASLAQAVELQRQVSRWLFQLNIVDSLYQSNSDAISPRIAMELYANLLREPTSADWTNQPLDTLALLVTPHEQSYENWLDVAFQRREVDRFFEISEMLRRHRFYSTLPMGGRLLALRWVLEAPQEVLGDDALARRRDLLNRYPSFEDLSRQSIQLRTELDRLPLTSEDSVESKKILDTAKKLHDVSGAQELLLRKIALGPEDSPLVFPPLIPTAGVQQQLSDDHLVMSIIDTSRVMYIGMLSRQRYAVWRVKSVPKLRQAIAAFLRGLGMHGDANTLTPKQLQDDSWKQSAESILDQIIEPAQRGFWNKFEWLTIVPDSFLWYFPFEVVPVDTDGAKTELFSAMHLSYAPTIGLALADKRPKPRREETTVVLGQLFPRDDPEMAREQIDQMSSVVEGLQPLPERLAAPTGLYRTTWQGLLVLDDIDNGKEDAYQWSPARLDAGRPGSQLSRWMALPWGGPRVVLLPGFHTRAESGLRKNADGNELFLAITGLMATGADTVMLTRWRTGGQTSYDLMREFLQELPHLKPAEAWRRSVHVVREIEIDPRYEPRLSAGSDEELIQAQHPFFWGGYLLVDRAAGDPQGATDGNVDQQAQAR